MNPPNAVKFGLETPCLILDADLLENNLQRMQKIASRNGKQLRPHAKTHKCSSLAKKQLEAGAIGICAAKVSEAEALVRAGIRGILVTGPVATPKKIERLVDLLPADPSLMTVVDNPDSTRMLDTALRAKGYSMDVLLDVDIGLHRTGVKPAQARALANVILSCPSLRLRGIQAYAGHVQHIPSFEARKETSLQCLAEAVAVFHELKTMADTCTILSSTGTGTFDIDLAVPEVTELQVGSYTCMDAEYLAIGSLTDPKCFASFSPALRLLTTVVSRNQEGFVTVDAGLKSLYRDGAVPLVLGTEPLAMTYDWFGDEYGKITCAPSTPLPSLGTVLELVTSHCDPTINLFDRYYLTRGNHVVDLWPIDLRGCSQ